MKQDSRSAEVGTKEFFRKALDSLTSQVAVLDRDGSILFVNASWRRFARSNGGVESLCGPGVNYLGTCEAATGDGSEDANRVARGIRDVVDSRRPEFSLMYPCHSPRAKRWSSVRISRFDDCGEVRVVVVHDDITQRRLAEIRLRRANRLLEIQATTDDLTGLPNRRSFDIGLRRESARRLRGGSPLTLALLDVDCFKALNDHLGHPAGDECLRSLGRAITSRLRLPIDLAARYGGEEFGIILPRTGAEEAAAILEDIRRTIRDLAIPNPRSAVAAGVVTASIGFSTTPVGEPILPAQLISHADQALYRAKRAGRDRVVAWEPPPP